MAMGLGTWLFGDKPEFETRQLPSMTPEQQALLKRLLAEFGKSKTLEGGGVTPFTGEMVAPLGDLEGLSLEALEQKILQQVSGTGTGAVAESALSDMIKKGGAPVDFEQYYTSKVRDPLLREYREDVLPELTRRFSGSAAFGSDRMLAEQQATQRLGETLAGARGELAYKTQSDAANRLLQAIQSAPGVQAGGTESLLKLMEGAGLPREIEQARRTAGYGEFVRQQEEKNRRVQQILASLGLKTTETLGTGLPGSEGLVAGAIKAWLGSSAAKGGFLG